MDACAMEASLREAESNAIPMQFPWEPSEEGGRGALNPKPCFKQQASWWVYITVQETWGSNTYTS